MYGSRLLPGLFFAATLVQADSGHATTHVVYPDGTGDFPTIQDAMNGATAGDTVLVGCGTYLEHDIQMTSGIVLVSENGSPDCATIDGQGLGDHVLFFENVVNTTVDGFTIRGGYADGSIWPHWAGAGLCCVESDSLIVRNCRVESNHATNGASALYCPNTTALVERVSFFANSSGALHGPTSSVLVCSGTASVTFSECTIAGNQVNDACLMVRVGAVTLDRTIIALTDGMGAAVVCNDGGTIAASCCDVYGNPGGDWTACISDQLGQDGNFSQDPQFCDPDAGDLRLRTESPCLPGNHPLGYFCGRIGARGAGCEAPFTDLAAVGFECFPDTAWSGPGEPDSLVIAGIFENTGNMYVGEFNVRIEVEGCIPFWGDSREFGPLVPGETDTIFARFGVEPAPCHATLIVDELNDIEEIDEENNLLVDVPVCTVISTPDVLLAPSALSLRVHPSPASGSVRLSFGTPMMEGARVSVFDVGGRRVWTQVLTTHHGVISWDRRAAAGFRVGGGVYFVSLEAGDQTRTRRLVLTP